MITVFIEYQIEPDKRMEFLLQQVIWEEEVRQLGGQHFRFYEGVDQPFLFVEEFEVQSMDEYRLCKERKKSNQPFSRCVKGGVDKIHIWAFQQVPDYKQR